MVVVDVEVLLPSELMSAMNFRVLSMISDSEPQLMKCCSADV